MNMTTLRQKSKIFIWVVLTGFFLSLVGVMGSSGGGFLGGASLTSFFSTTLNTNLYVGKIGDKKITRNEFAREIQNQRNTNQSFNATESFYIGRAWNALISNTISDEKIKQLNLATQSEELKDFLYYSPPSVLQNFLMDSTQNRTGTFFKDADGNFDLNEYQFTLDNNIDWMTQDLILSMSRYENALKNNYLPTEKLRNLYNKLTHVSNKYINEDIINNNTNCSIDILSIDYNQISDSLIEISQSDIQKYYDDNKNEKYKISESINLEYVIFENIQDEDDSLEIMLNEDQKQNAIDFALDCETMLFKDAITAYNLEIKDTLEITEDFSNNSGIPLVMGYDRRIVRFAFDNPKNSVSSRIPTDNGNVIFHILDSKNESFKSIEDVEEEIKTSLLDEKKKKYAENEISDMITNKLSISEIASKCNYCTINENEESTISGSFKTPGKNYKIMGALSVLNEGETSKIIDSNNTFYIFKLNKKEFSDDDTADNFNSSKERILNNLYRSIYNGWISYMIKNIETVDLRHKAI